MPTYLDQQNNLIVNSSAISNPFPKNSGFDTTNIEVNKAYLFFIRLDIHIYDKHRCQYWIKYTESTLVHILVGIN